MAGLHIQFLPDKREATVEPGSTLLEAARKAGVYVGAICGGEGVCGKCRVIVREGEVTGDSTEFLTRDEIRRGYVLACQVIPSSDLAVEVPPESQLAGYVGIGQDSERFRDFTHRSGQHPPAELAPLVEKFPLALPEPTLDDPTADQERLLSAVRRKRRGRCKWGSKSPAIWPACSARARRGGPPGLGSGTGG